MSKLIQDDAKKIAEKLGARIKPGKGHDIAKIYVNNKFIGQFGIRRSKKAGHDYIPSQIHTTMNNAIGLAKCTVKRDDWENELREKGIIA